MSLLLPLLGALRAAVSTHWNLALENLALRQQLALLRRRSKRLRFGSLDHVGLLLSKMKMRSEGVPCVAEQRKPT